MNPEFPYEVLEEFGRGGCSIIYKVKHKEHLDQKQYALKTMTLDDDEDQQGFKRFYMEWEFLRAYPHENLIEVREYFPDWHGRPAYVMEWVEGATWQNYWRDRKVLEETGLFLHLFKQLCASLDFIHKHQIIHRDLKPQNIMISEENQHLKLIDFGIMKVADLTMYTHRNTFMGSAYYVAPEGIADETVTHVADIFSLGVILYDLFTGMKPFQGHTLGETIYQRLVKKPKPPSQFADIPKELDDVILKMLEREPRKRQQSCQEIYQQLSSIFGGFQAETSKPVFSEIDILTKGTLLHSHFIAACDIFLREKNSLYLTGEEGCGKTTIIENLCDQMKLDTLIRLDCRPNSNEMEFMEAILRGIHLPTPISSKLVPYREILSAALPGLKWGEVVETQLMSFSTIFSAFSKVVMAVREPTAVVIEDLQAGPPYLMPFVQRFAQLVGTRANPHLNLILSSHAPLPALSAIGVPIKVSFPDIISLSEYLTSQFGGCQISVDLTESLLDISGKNVANFIRMIQQFKSSERLKINDGQLIMVDGPAYVSMEESLHATIPIGLAEFSAEEIRQLEWMALCPEGIGVKVITSVSGTDISTLSNTLNKAASFGVLEFQSNLTGGFRWRKPDLQEFLAHSLSGDEKIKRYLTLAKGVESESRHYLAQSPPLWPILCRLYQMAEEDERAAKYAFQYARYCFQTANYESIRQLLTQFIPLPHFQENQEFWCMLAMAYQDDASQALYYANKALRIRENVAVVALLSILEYQALNEKKARNYVERLMSMPDLKTLDLHYVSLLIPLLVILGKMNEAKAFYRVLETSLKGRNDLFATNSLILARMRLLQQKPALLIEHLKKLKGEMLPQTYRKLNLWASQAYQELFDFNHALGCLKCLDHSGLSDPRYYRDMLYLYFSFGKWNEVKKLISDFNVALEEHEQLKEVQPLFSLITQFLVKDPKIYNFPHVLSALMNSRVEKSSWLALILSNLDIRVVKSEFLKAALEHLHLACVPLVRYQILRIKILADVKSGKLMNLTKELQYALDIAHEHGLVMEKLRILILRHSLLQFGHTVAKVQHHFDREFLMNSEVFQFAQINPD